MITRRFLVTADPNRFPGLIAADREADMHFVNFRRRTSPNEQLDAVREHPAAGALPVGIASTRHPFAPPTRVALTDPIFSARPEFDLEPPGGHNSGHRQGDEKAMAAIEPGAARHTIRREISVGKLINRSVLYKFSPLAAAAPLLIGTMAEKHSEPLAWRRPLAASQARMFLISFGELDDFHLFVAPILRRKRFVKAVEL